MTPKEIKDERLNAAFKPWFDAMMKVGKAERALLDAGAPDELVKELAFAVTNFIIAGNRFCDEVK